MKINEENYNLFVEQYGEDLAKVMLKQEKEKQNNKTFVSRVERYGSKAVDIDKFSKNRTKSPYQQYLDEQNAKKESEKVQQDRESMFATMSNSLKSHCRKVLEDAFCDVENEIKHYYKVWEFDEFKNYKGLANRMIMNVVEKEYSPDILRKHEYKTGNSF